MTAVVRCAVLLATLLVPLPASAALWQDLDLQQRQLLGEAQIPTRSARVLGLDLAALQLQLAAAPMEFSGAAPQILSVPLPDGRSAAFHVQETRVMAPALAARYPQIRTYVGQGISDPAATLRLSVGPHAVHGMILSPQGTVYMDPVRQFDPDHLMVYDKADALPRESRRRYAPLLAGDRVRSEIGDYRPLTRSRNVRKSSGTELRTYRLVLATTGEYFQFHSPPLVPLVGNPLADKTPVLEELVNVVNRVTGIYEREVAVRLVLQAESENVMFSSAVADPYIDNDPVGIIAPFSMVLTNTYVLNALAGSASYDIGHVASTGGGGVAGLGVVCGSSKGEGVTGLPEPIGDPYYVDYVAHEMGHQFGGNHTFNSEQGSCGGNGNAGTAYEPGSGVTIQAYAGICGDDDLAPHSIDVFHGVSYDEIVAYTTEGGGNACAAVTPTTNHPPTADAGPAHTIPKQTPFMLTGAGSDPDAGDALTYQWEEFDLGPFGPVDVENGDAPLFRSFLPSTSPTRVFPRMEDLLNNHHAVGEILPAQERNMLFRLNVRDNAVMSGAGGVNYAFADVTIASAGPFRVTAPNDAQSLASGAELPVTWDVAGTDLPPVNCALVDIDLSADGGETFAYSLAAAVPNNGAASVKLPGEDLPAARLRVKCTDNIFFDVADADLAVAKSKSLGDRFGGAMPAALLGVLLLTALRRRRPH